MVNPRRTNDRDDDRHEDVSETPLVNVAAGRGYEGVLKLLLDSGASPNESRQFPRVPLSLAIQYGHDAAVRVLLAREDTTVTLPSAPFSQQPLHFALGRGSLECVLLLIERGADLQQYESTGSRALYPAISSGSHALVEFLVNRGCNPLGCCGYTALSLAAVMGHQSLVRYFLAQGVDPEMRDRTGFTALGHAAKAGHADVVETLLEWGVRRDNVGEDGETALCWAARENHAVVVEVLLRHGADPNSPNPRGIRPIHWAVTNGEKHSSISPHGGTIGRWLKCSSSWAPKWIHETTRGRTPFAVAAAGGHVAMMELLLANGADMTTRGRGTCAPLHRALWSCQDEAAAFLLRRGADPDFAAADGSRQPILAVRSRMVRVTRYLLEHGVDPDPLSNCGRTPRCLLPVRVNVHARNADRRTAIMFATGEDGDPQLVRLLLAHGANPDDQEEDGWSCLERAIGAGNEETARILVEAGANVNARDSYGQTALRLVHSRDPFYAYLLEKGAELCCRHHYHSDSYQLSK
ncbi:hypothetical protein KXV78_008444 [Aspergillus fumigatus]|nr:hypothetical protein KXV45_000800 [Aspergillus fumigatus]KAH2085452.1 hypothetical protein KXW32_004936 [Aspergillus fumigatus]KAH2379369.1 hypothetical protein KXV62_009206 [Aspergillus fumigatus]KAH2466752.1 hypothetical protein KXW63_003360 [Aspergillus fumigatus]KAH2582497.1 hypothetical protein KXV99_008852 [Aspergillus fumigatus]